MPQHTLTDVERLEINRILIEMPSDDQKINQIKHVRTVTGLQLKDAKVLVDHMHDKNGVIFESYLCSIPSMKMTILARLRSGVPLPIELPTLTDPEYLSDKPPPRPAGLLSREALRQRAALIAFRVYLGDSETAFEDAVDFAVSQANTLIKELDRTPLPDLPDLEEDEDELITEQVYDEPVTAALSLKKVKIA